MTDSFDDFLAAVEPSKPKIKKVGAKSVPQIKKIKAATEQPKIKRLIVKKRPADYLFADGPIPVASPVTETPMTPIREQAEVIKTNKIELLRDQIIETINSNRRDVRVNTENFEMVSWKAAELLARQNPTLRVGWDDGLDHEFVLRVRWCHQQLKTNSALPPLPSVTELYRPILGVPDLTKETLNRYALMSDRIIVYLQTAIAHNTENGTKFDMKSQSYRTVLASNTLENTLAEYAGGWRVPVGEDDQDGELRDEMLTVKCKKAAVAYFMSHRELSADELKPGPIDTLDPDFETYVRLCRDWKIPYGSMLHLAITQSEDQ